MTTAPALLHRLRYGVYVALMVLLAHVAWLRLAHAATAVPETAAPLPDAAFTWWGYVQALGVMFLVLGLLWAALWLLRRSGRFAGMPRADGLPRDSLYLERQLSLGPRKGLMVVRFLNKRLLLGVTEHQISLLTETELHDTQAFQHCLDAAAQGASAPEAAPEAPDDPHPPA